MNSAADCLAFMQGGCELKKVRPNSRIYCRFYTLEADLSCLRWEPSKKDGDRARLDVVSIREVRTGKSTETFLHNGPLCEQLAEEAAFSVIHGEDYQVRLNEGRGSLKVWVAQMIPFEVQPTCCMLPARSLRWHQSSTIPYVPLDQGTVIEENRENA